MSSLLSPTGLGVASLTGSETRVNVRTLDDRQVVWVDITGNETHLRLSSTASEQFVVAARVALAQRLPLVIEIGSVGVDIDEGIPALHAWGRIASALAACSGVVPTIAIVTGPAVSGPAILLGITDFAVMVESSYAFVTGPTVVESFTGIAISTDELGGAASHARYSGVATTVVPDRDAAIETVATLLSYLPGHVDEEPPRAVVDDPADRPCPEAGDVIPATSTGSYDVRKVAAAIVDDDSLFEVRGRWAGNAVTAFATLGGRPVGIVANQIGRAHV